MMTRSETNRLTYDILEHQVKVQLVRYTLICGQGGPLALLWSLGIAVFVLFLKSSSFVLPWTIAILGLMFLAARDYLKNSLVHKHLVAAVVDKRFSRQGLTDAGLIRTFENAKGLFVEVAQKIAEIEKKHGKDTDLRQVLADTDAMLALQFESARQVEEFGRVLSLVGAGRERVPEMGSEMDDDADETLAQLSGTARRHYENVARIQGEAAKARALVNEILQRLEIVMLQVAQMDRAASDVVQSAEFARQTEKLLETIQTEVDARRDAAQTVIEMLAF